MYPPLLCIGEKGLNGKIVALLFASLPGAILEPPLAARQFQHICSYFLDFFYFEFKVSFYGFKMQLRVFGVFLVYKLREMC